MKQLLEQLAASPEEERLAAARQAIEELNGPLAESARKRGRAVSRRQQAYAELVGISPTQGPDNLIADPADADPAIRQRRVDLRKEIADLDRQIAHEDDVRRELDPLMVEARRNSAVAEYGLDRKQMRDAVRTLAAKGLDFRDHGLWAAHEAIERVQRKYPSHEFLEGNVTLNAHAGAPPILRHINFAMDNLRLLLEAIATWDRSMLDPDEPAHQRATSIERAEIHLAEATVAAQRRQVELSRSKHPLPPPLPPRSDLEMIATLNAEANARNKVIH